MGTDIHSLIFIQAHFTLSLSTQLLFVERELCMHKNIWSFIKRKAVPCGSVGRPPEAGAWDECLLDGCLLGQLSPHTPLRQGPTNCCYGPNFDLFLGSHFYLEEERQRNHLYKISPFNSYLSIYYEPASILGSNNQTLNKTDTFPGLVELTELFTEIPTS